MKLRMLLNEIFEDSRCVFYHYYSTVSGPIHEVQIHEEYTNERGAGKKISEFSNKNFSEIVKWLKQKNISNLIIKGVVETKFYDCIIDQFGKLHNN